MGFEDSKQNGPHAELQKLVGEWEGMTTTWFEPGVVADESPMAGKITSILGGRFVLHEYSGQLTGNAFEGIALYGYDLATNKFQSAWADSFHMSTGLMFSEGEPGEKFAVSGTYYAGADSPRWGWRTEVEVAGKNTLVITAYNVMPDGQEAKATETRYSRKV